MLLHVNDDITDSDGFTFSFSYLYAMLKKTSSYIYRDAMQPSYPQSSNVIFSIHEKE